MRTTVPKKQVRHCTFGRQQRNGVNMRKNTLKKRGLYCQICRVIFLTQKHQERHIARKRQQESYRRIVANFRWTRTPVQSVTLKKGDSDKTWTALEAVEFINKWDLQQEQEEKTARDDKVTCQICWCSTRGVKEVIGKRCETTYYHPESILTCTVCVREFHQNCLRKGIVAYVKQEILRQNTEAEEAFPDHDLPQRVQDLTRIAPTPCCRSPFSTAIQVGVSDIKTEFDDIPNGKRRH